MAEYSITTHSHGDHPGLETIFRTGKMQRGGPNEALLLLAIPFIHDEPPWYVKLQTLPD